MTKPTDSKEFRKAYVAGPFSKRPLAAGLSRDARGEGPNVETDVLTITARWNERIPVNRVRVLTQDRYELLARALGTFGRDEILAAVECYASQAWQRQKKAWKRFHNFFAVPALTLWVEEAMAAAEKAEQRKAPKDPRVAKLTEQIAAKQTAWNRRYELQRRFDKLPVKEKRRLWVKARAELARVGRTDPTRHETMRCVLRIIEHEEAEK